MRPTIPAVLVTTALMGLAGCAVGPDFEKPAAPDAKGYTDLPDTTSAAGTKEGNAQSFAMGQDVPADWWKLFGSDDLNQLVAQALKNNPDLAAANAALKQAHENYLAARGDILPTVDANFDPTREKFNPAAFGETGLPSSIFTLYSASVSVSYGIDIFGGERREIEEQRALADYQRDERDAAYMALTANVVTAAVQEASLREQVVETQTIIDDQSKQLNILQKQFELGGLQKSVVLQQQTLLAQTQATLPQLQKQLALQRNQLSILVGKLPSDGPGASFTLDTLHLPEDLPVTLPSQLVEQRPDIRAATEQLHAASAAVGVATAEMLPQVSLTGTYGYENTHFNNLFKAGSSVWSFGGDLLQPIFHGGALWHGRRAAEAALEKAQAQYQSTVLQAFANVANTLKALQYDADALAAQSSAVQAAQNALDLTQAQFKDGAVSYPQLLTAQQSYQQSRVALAQAEGQRLADTAALFLALGGSWQSHVDAAKPPAEAPQQSFPEGQPPPKADTLTPLLAPETVPEATPAPAVVPAITVPATASPVIPETTPATPANTSTPTPAQSGNPS